jgi:IS30 family transposase
MIAIASAFPHAVNVSHAEVREIEILLNNRPRACLGFRTPAEVFFEEFTDFSCV